MQQGERALARSPCLVSTVAPLPSFRFQSEACGFLVSTQPSAAGSSAFAYHIIYMACRIPWLRLPLLFNPQQAEQCADAFLQAQAGGVEAEGRICGDFEGGGDAGEMGDFAAAGFGVEALDIAALALFEGRGDEYFLEIVGADDLGGHLAHLFGGTDKGGDGDDARIYEEFGHFGDAADILATVLGRETEIGIDTCADIVAIEDAA